jgi:hypothetical protein
MKPFLAVGLVMIALLVADMLLNRRRRMHDHRAREHMAAHARRLQQGWDSRPK